MRLQGSCFSLFNWGQPAKIGVVGICCDFSATEKCSRNFSSGRNFQKIFPGLRCGKKIPEVLAKIFCREIFAKNFFRLKKFPAEKIEPWFHQQKLTNPII
jgi:hypothetical protein